MKKIRNWLQGWLGIEDLETCVHRDRRVAEEWLKEFQAELDGRLEKLENRPLDSAKMDDPERSNVTNGYVPWSQRRALREARNTQVAEMARKIKSALKE